LGWSQRSADGAAVICLSGELDLATAAELRRRLMRVAESSNATTIVLDVADVSFIDAGCAGVILAAWETARDRGRQLRVDGLQATTRRVFDILGLRPILVRRAETRDD
jgi:anti-sigma B factor antagonist